MAEENKITEEKKPRKNKKDEEIKTLTLKLEEEHNLLLRTAAEFDNYKKRTEREKLTVGEYAKADIIKKILPVLDNIERASGLDTASAEYIKGIELIVKQFSSLAENMGIVPLAKVGGEFNPSVHDAVMHIDDENFGENVIADVLQQGYKIGETVIRPAMVKVAN